MFFLNPTYLWALLGLTIPIAIHLWSKKEGKTIKIGSIQLLREVDSKQNSSIQLNELLLLLLRLSLITILVLILAEPQIKRDIQNTKLTYLVEPSLLKNNSIIKLLDTISSETSIKLLQKGFPELDIDEVSNLNETTPNYWQLAQDMDALHSDSIIVFTNGLLKGLKGKRPDINANVEWIVLDESKTSENIIKAIKKEDAIETISQISSSQNVSFKKEKVPLNSNAIQWSQPQDSLKINNEWLTVETEIPLKVAIFNDIDFAKEAAYINAAFMAISKYINQPIEVSIVKQDTTKLNSANFNYVVWLSDQEPKEVPGKLLTYNPDIFVSSLIVEGNKNNVFHLTERLDSETIIDKHLAEQLLRTLNLHGDLKEIISKNDKRIIAKEELQPVVKKVETQKSYASVLNVSKWLWLLLASLLITERIVANYRKQ